MTKKKKKKKKNGDEAKSAANKSLNDVSNITKKEDRNQLEDNDDELDRLHLVQSHLSSLVHQIDELVVQASKVSACKQGREDIELFINLLSDIKSSLKPWGPRLQKTLSNSSTDSGNQFGESLMCKSGVALREDKKLLVDSPSPTEFTSLVPPSPLVPWDSWRANCQGERDPQLFLVTPLPSHTRFASNQHEPSKSFLGRINSNSTGRRTFTDDRNGTACKSLKTLSSFSTKGNSMPVMTPCLKRSPPKSCILLEPISEISLDRKCRYRKSTPYPVGIHRFDDSDSSICSKQSSENLAIKYPELFGIHQAYKMGAQKEIVESIDCLRSPPKSCVLMEPSEAGVFNQPSDDIQETVSSSSAVPESTPMWKEPQSTTRKGKRPGENTLKRELWTKFEQETIKRSHKKIPVLDAFQKDFLDRLNAVSCQQTSSMKDLKKK